MAAEELPTLPALLVQALRHSGSSHKRQAALTALERLVACAGPAAFKVPAYEHCPSLLPTLLQLLATEGEDTKAVKLLGMLGALEPLQYRAIIARAAEPRGAEGGAAEAPPLAAPDLYKDDAPRVTTEDGGGFAESLPLAGRGQGSIGMLGGEGGINGGINGGGGRNAAGWGALEWGEDPPVSSAQYLPSVALRALLAILHDASLSACHHRLIAALVYIFTSLGEQCAPFLPRVMPTLLAILLQPQAQAPQMAGRREGAPTTPGGRGAPGAPTEPAMARERSFSKGPSFSKVAP